MSLYIEYIQEIEVRKAEGLHPKPIDSGDLLAEIISQIKDTAHEHRADSLNFFIYNTLPGTTSAAAEKAAFIKQIILGESAVPEISTDFGFELLSHMKGGPSVEVLLDLALGGDAAIAKQALEVLKTQVFLYEADTDRLESAFKDGSNIAKELLESYAAAEFFTKLPEVDEEIEVVTFIAAEGDISTDLLSPGNQAHSRADRELHGKCMISPEAQAEIQALQKQHPGKRVMLIADKGTMGVGSSRMSGVNNVALWTGKPASPYVPFVNFAPIVAGTNGISPIFLTTVGVTGGIGLDLKNWVKKLDASGKPVLDDNGDPVLEQTYSVETGKVLTINTKSQKLYEDGVERADISSALSPQKMEFIKAGGSYAIVFGKKVGVSDDVVLHAGSDVRVKVNIVGSQDTTGLMTSQELEAMAATIISPTVDGAYQSGCHTASVWDAKAQENIPRLMGFMQKFGLITARDPNNAYHPMTDVIHKVLNDITVDEWAIIIGGDSHTRMSKGVAFGADSGTVALALATGEATMPIPESVKVTFEGELKDYMDFRDVVHATQLQMLKKFGDNVFQGRVIEVHIGTLLADQAFTFTDYNATYFAELVVDLNQINEPMIADPDVHNDDVSKRYTHDVIRALSHYEGAKEVDLGFIGSCMVHKGDMQIISRVLKNLEKKNGKIEFKAPLVVAAPTYNIIDELKEEGDWDVLQKYSGFEFDDSAPKQAARTEYENMMYLERPGCNLCMGNQEKAAKGDTVLATSTRLFQGRVVEDSERKKGESLLASTPVVVLASVLGRTPSIEEYRDAVEGISLTKFAPPLEKLSVTESTVSFMPRT